MELNKQNIKKILGIIAAAIIMYVGLQNSRSVINLFYSLFSLLAPFIVGICIAFVLNVPMRFIERHLFYHGKNKTSQEGKEKRIREKIARPISILVTILLVLLLLVIIIFMVAPELGKTFWTMIDTIQNFVNGEQATWLDKLTEHFPKIEQALKDLRIDWRMVGNNIVNFVKEGFGGALDSTVKLVGSIVNQVINFFLGLVFAIYILLSKETLALQGKQLLYSFFKEDRADHMIGVFRLINRTFSNFLSGQCLDATILGLMFFIAMTLFKFPYAPLLSVFIGFTALIPVFGSFIGCVVALFMLLMVSPIKALWFLILFLVLQQLEETFVYPNIVGKSVSLPAIWTFGAVILGGSMMGIIGMLLFIPGTSVIYSIMNGIMEKRLKDRAISPEKWKKQMDFLYPAEEATNKRKFLKRNKKREK